MTLLRISVRRACAFLVVWSILVYCIASILHDARFKETKNIPRTEKDDKAYPHQHMQLKENLAVKLIDIYDEVKSVTSGKSPKTLERFEEIFKLLNISLPQLKRSVPLYEKRTAKHIVEEKMLDVCPEKFPGTEAEFGYPYFKEGWYITNCSNVKPLPSVITFLINAVRYSSSDLGRLQYVLNGMNQTYPLVKVFLAINNNQTLPNSIKKYNTLEIVNLTYSASAMVGKAWNALIMKASTPYVLIARDIVHFSWVAQIKRQIRVVSEVPNVAVAGGAYRNTSGHWQMGCFQTTMKNYVLQYQEGYYHSRNECMLCDYLQGPFVARKSLVKFDENINDETVFEDLFLTLRKNKVLIMGCPDAMYFTKDETTVSKQPSREVWQKIATKWVLNRIILSMGIKHKFSCSDIGYKCNMQSTRSYLLSVCCQEEFEHAVAVLQQFSKTVNISFELGAGSVLGGVKFNGFMPWDMDGDVRVLTKEIHNFNKPESKKYFKDRGLQLGKYEKPIFHKTVKSDGYVQINMPAGLFIEVWGRKQLTCPQFLPDDLKHITTLAHVRGTWVNTVYSPGLYVRNRFGHDLLKHSQSWTMLGYKHSAIPYTNLKFLKCQNPGHHSCLDQFTADGNIPFLVD